MQLPQTESASIRERGPSLKTSSINMLYKRLRNLIGREKLTNNIVDHNRRYFWFLLHQLAEPP